MAESASDLAALWSGLVKLLPLAGCFTGDFGYKRATELIHRMRLIRACLRELSSTRSVYPGVEWLCIDIGKARTHAE